MIIATQRKETGHASCFRGAQLTSMTITASIRGNRVTWDEDRRLWLFDDGVASEEDIRACTYCLQMPDEVGRDPCLGYIPAVTSACCGHGGPDGFVRLRIDRSREDCCVNV